MRIATAASMHTLRRSYFAAVTATAAAASATFYLVLAADGLQALEAPLLCVFTLLVLWLSLSFWAAVVGFFACLRPQPAASPRPDAGDREVHGAAPASRTAVLLPVYNESATRLVATLRALRASLARTPHADRFDVFVLSDTNDPDAWVEEEEAWAQVALDGGPGGVFYRRRARNLGRKSGNIAEWCGRWGGGYTYMAVLDADSLMEGATLVEMVRRMDASPRVAILQTTPSIVNQGTLFARTQQFATSVYGPVHRAGFAVLARHDANYWGHNALLRIEPFARHCGLPRLPGAAPLGGEILSHDFVEAALLRSAGQGVRLADDLEGSYEEMPPTLVEYAQRDQRWCQGNLQHLRLLVSRGFRPLSRLHFGMGAMAYLAAPLWAAFLVLGVLAAPTSLAHAPPHSLSLALVGGTFAMLFLPKLAGLFLVLRDRARAADHGGAWRVGVSASLEVVLSAVVAPILMAFHTQFVVAALSGRSVSWDTQRRDVGSTALREAARVHAPHTAAGLGAAAFVAAFAPSLFLWMTPVFFGLVFSIPFSMAFGSRRIGLALRRAGLLLVPEETRPSPVLEGFRRERLAARAREIVRRRTAADPIERALTEPVLHAIHLDFLDADGSVHAPASVARSIQRIVLSRGAAALGRAQRTALLSDAALFRELHRQHWAGAHQSG